VTNACTAAHLPELEKFTDAMLYTSYKIVVREKHDGISHVLGVTIALIQSILHGQAPLNMPEADARRRYGAKDPMWHPRWLATGKDPTPGGKSRGRPEKNHVGILDGGRPSNTRLGHTRPLSSTQYGAAYTT
jgi:hypothetical protein